MSSRTIFIDIIETSTMLEVELEDSIQAKTLVSRLKHESYLHVSINYFVKTENGTCINENTTVKNLPENIVITDNEKWMQVFSDSFDEEYITEISNGVALCDNIYWFFPLFEKFRWADATKRCHLFEITDVRLVNGDFLTAYALVQYSLMNELLFSNQNTRECHAKIQQIVTDTLKIEFAANNMATKDFFTEMAAIEQKMYDYVNAHTELNWFVKIEAVSILGLNHLSEGRSAVNI